MTLYIDFTLYYIDFGIAKAQAHCLLRISGRLSFENQCNLFFENFLFLLWKIHFWKFVADFARAFGALCWNLSKVILLKTPIFNWIFFFSQTSLGCSISPSKVISRKNKNLPPMYSMSWQENTFYFQYEKHSTVSKRTRFIAITVIPRFF